MEAESAALSDSPADSRADSVPGGRVSAVGPDREGEQQRCKMERESGALFTVILIDEWMELFLLTTYSKSFRSMSDDVKLLRTI